MFDIIAAGEINYRRCCSVSEQKEIAAPSSKCSGYSLASSLG